MTYINISWKVDIHIFVYSNTQKDTDTKILKECPKLYFKRKNNQRCIRH